MEDLKRRKKRFDNKLHSLVNALVPEQTGYVLSIKEKNKDGNDYVWTWTADLGDKLYTYIQCKIKRDSNEHWYK